MRQHGDREGAPSVPDAASTRASLAIRGKQASLPEDELPDRVSREVEGLLRVVAEESMPEPNADLIRKTFARVRGMLLIRDLAAFATLESIWESLERRRDR